MAASGYRKAVEPKPATAVLEERLRGVNARTVSISYPMIEPPADPLLSQLLVSGQTFKLEKVIDGNVMARCARKDEMPGMVLRGFTRAVVKGVVQDPLHLPGAVLDSAASAVTGQADDRLWRMLPGRVYVALGYLPEGEQKVNIDGQEVNVKVAAKKPAIKMLAATPAANQSQLNFRNRHAAGRKKNGLRLWLPPYHLVTGSLCPAQSGHSGRRRPQGGAAQRYLDRPGRPGQRGKRKPDGVLPLSLV